MYKKLVLTLILLILLGSVFFVFARGDKGVPHEGQVVLNVNSGIYHHPDCKFAKKCTKNCVIIDQEDLPENARFCNYCRTHHPVKKPVLEVSDFTETEPPAPERDDKVIELPIPDVSTEFIDIYFIDSTKYNRPASYCRTSACQALLKEIKNAQQSIDFAIYGISSQPEIFNALINAQERGVKLRGIVDMNINFKNPYGDTHNLINTLKTVKTDYLIDKKTSGRARSKFPEGAKDYPKIEYKDRAYIPGRIMHNKFFIFDDNKVWTGSTNISSSGTGGYNINEASLIRSPDAVEVFKQEFNQMYEGNFHDFKEKINKENLKLPDGTVLSIYFSPKNDTINTALIPLIDSAREQIYVAAFFLTQNDLISSLVRAHDRGVKVKIIADAAGAKTSPFGIRRLRNAGLAVKVENFGGKMHMKTIFIDGTHLVTGSMNLTRAGNVLHDENTVIIQNNEIAQGFKDFFYKLWQEIPDKCLYASPKPEGPDSPVSCFDGIDNDHDGYTDMEDYDCR